MNQFQTKCSKILNLMVNITKRDQSFGYQFLSRYEILTEHELLKRPENQLLIRMNVDPTFGNLHRTLHGGASATIVDTATTVALSGFDKKERINTTCNLSLDYMAPAKLESDIYILNEVQKVGRTLGFTECRIFNEDLRLLVTGKHNKILLDQKYDIENETW